LAKRDLRKDFLWQKAGSKKRGIPWQLTFDEWLSIWKKSGKLHRRGKYREHYVMARYGDTGPYSPTNVYITTIEDNSSTGQAGKSKKPDQRRKIAQSVSKRKHKSVHTPVGVFRTSRECADYYGISTTTVKDRCRSQTELFRDWFLVDNPK
jgi:hypothetical protein